MNEFNIYNPNGTADHHREKVVTALERNAIWTKRRNVQFTTNQKVGH